MLIIFKQMGEFCSKSASYMVFARHIQRDFYHHLTSCYNPARGNRILPIERRQYMTPIEMQEKAMQVFGQGLQ
jgi:hypothetical protein